MRVKVIFIVTVLTTLYPSNTFSIENNKSQNSTLDIHETKHPTPSRYPINFKTDELINQQSENIRHIIETEQRNHEQRDRQDDPKQVKKEKALVAIDDERFPTLEELRAKCQHFSRLFGLSQSGSSAVENYGNGELTERYYSSTVAPPRSDFYNRPIVEVTRRPVFIRNKPTFLQKNNAGFYVTASPMGNEITTTKKYFWGSSTTYPRIAYSPSEHSTKFTTTTTTSSTTTSTTPQVPSVTPTIENITDSTTAGPKIKIKYTNFEPVILQKTILTDGRVMYHWHRSLPTATVDLPAPTAPLATPIIQSPTYEYPPVAATMPLAQRNLGAIEPNTLGLPTTSTTTTEKSSWLFVPFSSLFGGSHEEETTTVESNTTPPTTSTSSTTSKNIFETNSTPKPNLPPSTTDNTKLAQLKLIVPVHYDDIDSSISAQNNRLGYYRKTVGTAYEEAPPSSLQVIKTLGVPQSIPRYVLGYTGAGYGLINNGMPYGAPYSPEYVNYQPYSNVPLEREDKKLEDVSL